MTGQQTIQRRSRVGFTTAAPRLKPILESTDEGDPIKIRGSLIGASGDRWIDPFLAANDAALQRLGLSVEVRSAGGIHVQVRPSRKIGAVPIVAPATRRVVAGILISPRFRWSALGDVMSAIGFSVAPTVGGGQLVPGSALDVPPWLIAGPVLRRIEDLMSHGRSIFVERTETRLSARGDVRWGEWARQQVPNGHWTRLPCRYSDLDNDPELMAAVRWTLDRLRHDLSASAGIGPANTLLAQLERMRLEVGEGPLVRPSADIGNELDLRVSDATEAMLWIAEQRGLGGAGGHPGLAWDLTISDLWEEWVRTFARDLAPHCGLIASSDGEVRRQLRWEGSLTSMSSLAPDVGLFASDRTIWLDAKYKAHLAAIGRHQWSGVSEWVREAHRADLHQALAYTSLSDSATVDTILVYPSLSTVGTPLIQTIARVTSGKRTIRLILAALPFGFSTPALRETAISEWREMLAA